MLWQYMVDIYDWHIVKIDEMVLYIVTISRDSIPTNKITGLMYRWNKPKYQRGITIEICRIENDKAMLF